MRIAAGLLCALLAALPCSQAGAQRVGGGTGSHTGTGKGTGTHIGTGTGTGTGPGTGGTVGIGTGTTTTGTQTGATGRYIDGEIWDAMRGRASDYAGQTAWGKKRP